MTFYLKKTKIIAHRGASKEAPENTIAAIKRALSLNADCIEIDVRLSKEGIPIVLHDKSAARVAGIKSAPPIHKLTLPQIQQIDIGKHFAGEFIGEKIPTLLEVLNLEWNNTGLMIEIKEGPQKPKVLVNAVFDDLAKAPNLPSLLIGSFSIEIIQEIQKRLRCAQMPVEVEVIGIVEEPEMLARFIAQKIQRVALWHTLITPDLMKRLEARGIEVWAFTLDELERARFVASLGVSGIISNDPKTMMQENLEAK